MASRRKVVAKEPPLLLEGAAEFIAACKAATGALDMTSPETGKVMLEGAKIVAAESRRRAPKKDGTLRKAHRARRSKRRSKYYGSAYAAVDRRKAPHAHLVEFGHLLVLGGKAVGNVPAYPFMRPAIEATKAKVADTIAQGLAFGIEVAVSRRKKYNKRGRGKASGKR